MTSFIDYDSQMTPGYDIEISCIFTDSTKNRFQLLVSFTFELSINSRADVRAVTFWILQVCVGESLRGRQIGTGEGEGEGGEHIDREERRTTWRIDHPEKHIFTAKIATVNQVGED